jgi:hypothetical protein
VLYNSWETNYEEALQKENTLIQKKLEKVEKYTKYVITKNYITQEREGYEKILLTIFGRIL